MEHDEQFFLDSPRARLAKQAAQFILKAEKSTGYAKFAQNLAQTIQNLVERVKGAGYKSFSTMESHYFHEVRSSRLKEIWNELWLALRGDQEFKDPLLMQHCNTKLFEKFIRLGFPIMTSGKVSGSEDLSDHEEMAL